MQHRELVGKLQEAGWEVQYEVIVLGHCGSVFRRDMETMQELGVPRDKLEGLFSGLHDNAVKYTCAAARLYQQLRSARNSELGYGWRAAGRVQGGG